MQTPILKKLKITVLGVCFVFLLMLGLSIKFSIIQLGPKEVGGAEIPAFSYDSARDCLKFGKEICFFNVKVGELGESPLYIEALTQTGVEGKRYRLPVHLKFEPFPYSTTLTNQTVEVTVDTASLIAAGKMESNCSDMVFTDVNGGSVLIHTIVSGCNTESTKISLIVPQVLGWSSSPIYMYYGTPEAGEPETGNLVADWRMDESSGSTVNDYSGYSNNGVANGPTIVSGYSGNARRFDGVDDYVRIPEAESLNITGSFTIDVWVYRENEKTGADPRIVTSEAPVDGISWGSITLQINDAHGPEQEGKAVCGFFDGEAYIDAESYTSVPLNQWVHLVCVFDSAQKSLVLYLNDTASSVIWRNDVMIEEVTTLPQESRAWNIGRMRIWNGSYDYNFQGRIDEVRIYNYASYAPEASLRAIVGHERILEGARGTKPVLYIQEGTGSVGIGTTRPVATLDVHGSLNVHGGFLRVIPDKVSQAALSVRGQVTMPKDDYGWQIFNKYDRDGTAFKFRKVSDIEDVSNFVDLGSIDNDGNMLLHGGGLGDESWSTGYLSGGNGIPGLPKWAELSTPSNYKGIFNSGGSLISVINVWSTNISEYYMMAVGDYAEFDIPTNLRWGLQGNFEDLIVSVGSHWYPGDANGGFEAVIEFWDSNANKWVGSGATITGTGTTRHPCSIPYSNPPHVTRARFRITVDNGNPGVRIAVLRMFARIRYGEAISLVQGQEAYFDNIYSTGKIGIGTTEPGANLHISDSSDYLQLLLHRTGSSQKLYFGSVWDSVGSFIGGNNYYSSSWQHIPSYTAASGIYFRNDGSIQMYTDTGLTAGVAYDPTERVTISTTGKVGIGTTGPVAKLDVRGSVFAWGESTGFLTDARDSARVGLIKYSGKEGGIWRTSAQDFEIGRVDSGVTALPGSPTTWTTDLYVSGTGKVGIGTTNPQSQLQVDGYIQFDLTSGQPPAADCNDSSERGRAKVDSGSRYLYICTNSGWKRAFLY